MKRSHDEAIEGDKDKLTTSSPEPSYRNLPFKKRFCRDVISQLNIADEEPVFSSYQQGGRESVIVYPKITPDISANNTTQNELYNDEVFGEVTNKTAFKGLVNTVKLRNNHRIVEPKSFLKSIKIRVQKIISDQLKVKKAIKVNMVFNATLHKPENNKVTMKGNYKTKNTTFLQNSNISRQINKMYDNVLTEFDAQSAKGSGWTLQKVDNLVVRVSKFNIIKAGSYLPLPIKIRKRKAVINVETKENDCFKLAV